MKRSTRSTLLATIVASVAACALGLAAQAQTVSVGNSVADPTSKHNLPAVFGNTAFDTRYGTNQVCLPCHTPHQMPDKEVDHLWNHELNPASSYTLFGSGSNYLSTTSGSITTYYVDEVSRKCLGCHDGTLALDSYGPRIGAATMGTMATETDASGQSTAGYVVGAGGDLRHDHPIDVLYNSSTRYTLSGTTLTWNSTRTNDPATFKSTGYTSSMWGPKTYTPAGLSAISFYRPSGVSTTVSNGSTSASTQALYVNCRSCHDPHNNLYNFLRVPNNNSQLCLTCHNK